MCCRSATVGFLTHFLRLVGKTSESRSSGRKYGSVLSRELGETPRSTRLDGARRSKGPVDLTGDYLSSRRSSRARPTKSRADLRRSEASDDDTAGEEEQEMEVRKRGSSKRPMGESRCYCVFPSMCGSLELIPLLTLLPGRQNLWVASIEKGQIATR
jgi:hypothetical protein